MRPDRIKVFAGNSNPALAEQVCASLGVPLGEALLSTFSDGEVRVEIRENVRGKDVYVIQSTCRPVNQNLMELLVMIDALKRASSKRINVVIPYYGYGRQDQKEKPRVSITAKLTADLISVAGAGRIVAFDLHADQIQGFFNIPVENISGTRVLLEDLKLRYQGDEVIVAPDAGGVGRAREFAKWLESDLAIMDHRGLPSEMTSCIVGDVKDRPVILLDDMVDTGTTLIRAADAAHAAGARSVDAYCVHGILSGSAIEDLDRSHVRSLVITDSIPLPPAAEGKRIRVVGIGPVLAEAIRRVHCAKSLSSLVE